MKVIFVNAPYIKNPNANAANNFTIATSFLDKLRTPHICKNMLGGKCIIYSLAFFLVSIMVHVMV